MDRHNENDDMHMKDTQNTEAQEEACAGAEADVEAGAVARVLQSGYKLGERLLRPAKVMIKPG